MSDERVHVEDVELETIKEDVLYSKVSWRLLPLFFCMVDEGICMLG